MQPLRAISIRQPWCHAILHLGKDVENRGRTNPHRGLTMIHASAGMTAEEYDAAEAFMHSRGLLGGRLPHRSVIDRGGIVGVVEIVDSARGSESPWYMGACVFTLRNPRAVPFVPCRGTVAPLFWIPDATVQAKVAAALRA